MSVMHFWTILFCPKWSGQWTTSPSIYPGVTTGQPGLHLTTHPHSGRPGLQTTEGEWLNMFTSCPTTRQDPRINTSYRMTYVVISILFSFTATWITTPHDGGLPRVLCVEGQFACQSFGCVDSAQVCDGRQDCLDGSDEKRCGMHQNWWTNTLI